MGAMGTSMLHKKRQKNRKVFGHPMPDIAQI
jgi:hypothetical protein